MNKKIIKSVFSTEWIYGLIYGTFAFLSYCLLSFLLFDEKRVYSEYGGESMINGKDYDFIDILGVKGIARQSYILPFFFLMVATIVFFFLWSYLSYRKHCNDISLMRVRGISKSKSQFAFLRARGLLFLFASLISILPYILFIFAFYWVAQTKYIIIHFTPWVFLLIFISLLAFLIVSFPFYTKPYKKDRLIRFLRENY